MASKKKYFLLINPTISEEGKTAQVDEMYGFSNLEDAKTAAEMLLEWGEYVESYDIVETSTKKKTVPTETVSFSYGALAPIQKTSIPLCQCSPTDRKYVVVNTNNDDFMYDECPVCGKMIAGSARAYEDED